MNIHKLADISYEASRKIVGALGLMGPARRLLGPVIGRLLFGKVRPYSTQWELHVPCPRRRVSAFVDGVWQI